ncbi:lysozyme [Candidatus Synechococcus calcipolaris G9]|uniref:Lysozyme n=1 Tax=Candidatus Synechococcus calcipolaris G9 TaxID=1497997 RepID=A0ABT6EVR7_9SYNE|nr:lysozyme [Candidatus Synechococcus calcipolaris]MDG2989482.1 lysozyme [Candidatus Synechococcus calcipolaris G9]
MLDDAADLIKHFEGLSLTAYRCPAGIWTIGWGATIGQTGQPIHPNQTVSLAEANTLLQRDMGIAQDGLMKLVQVSLSDLERQALVSFVFNIGLGAFGRSTLLFLLNQGHKAEAAKQFDRWVYADGKVLAGLERRRKAEKAMFLGQNWRDQGLILGKL